MGQRKVLAEYDVSVLPIKYMVILKSDNEFITCRLSAYAPK